MSKKYLTREHVVRHRSLRALFLLVVFSRYADDPACLLVKFYEDNFGMSLVNKSVNELPTYSPLHKSTQFVAYKH